MPEEHNISYITKINPDSIKNPINKLDWFLLDRNFCVIDRAHNMDELLIRADLMGINKDNISLTIKSLPDLVKFINFISRNGLLDIENSKILNRIAESINLETINNYKGIKSLFKALEEIVNNHNDYINILNRINTKCDYVEVVILDEKKSNELVDKFKECIDKSFRMLIEE